MTTDALLLTLDGAHGAERHRIGAKAAALAAARMAGFPVPQGVVIEPDDTLDAAALAAVLGGGPYAARSSSVLEDGVEHSWAGQFESRLPVEADELDAAVEEVRSSGANERAGAYGRDPRPIPVLVQPVVDARAAGVGFSLDPRDGDERFLVVEAVAGLATSVTDGEVVPERWRVDLSTGARHRQIDGPLTQAALDDVVALTDDVAEWLGRPCDIEWAWDGERVWLLQARAITAAAWQPAPGQWTAANLRENVPGVATPLTASNTFERLLAETIDASLRRIGLAREGEVVAKVRRFYGHLYWRIDVLKQRLAAVPGFSETAFDAAIGIAPIDDAPRRRARVSPRALARGFRAIAALGWMFARTGRGARRTLARFEREESGWLAYDWDAPSAPVAAAAIAEARALHEVAYREALTVTFLAEQAQELVAQLASQLGASLDPPLDVSLLLAGMGEVATAAAGSGIDALARRHAADAGAVLAAASIDELPAPVDAGLHEVIAEFGWMASADDELANPRWDEDHALPLAFLQGAVRMHLEGAPPAAGDGGATARRLSEERRLIAAAGAWGGAVKGALRLARRYGALREETRVMAGRANRVLRRAALARGRRLAAAGALAEAGDAFWLTADELFAPMPPSAAAARVAARRRHARRFRAWEPPLVLGVGTAREDSPSDGWTLRGVPCSSGLARGRIAVLHRLADVARVDPGAILVLKHGNPGWTPAFLAARGLVIEQSGLLSHTSVIARERGLPTVINVERATELLHDGQEVEIDGRRGSITILEGQSA